MFYKVSLNDAIIDAIETPLSCVRYDERSQMVLRCEERDNPQGIILDRTGRYYHVSAWPEFPAEVDGSAGDVDIAEIDETTYEEMLAALNDGEVPEDGSLHEPDPEPEAPETKETTAQKLSRELADANRKIVEQDKQIDFLTNCLLEMSEIIYA